MGTRGSGFPCACWAKPWEPPLWSSHPVPAKGSMVLAALCAFPVPPAAAVTRTAQTPAFLILFGSPFPFSFGRVQTLLWSLFLFWYFTLLAWSLWPGAYCLPGSSVLPLWFLLQLLVSPLKPPLSQNWCSLDDLQSLNTPPGAAQVG